MSDENITFVGGKAIEQHETAESNVDTDTREDAMAAVRDAIKGAAEEAKEGAKKVEEAWRPPGAKKDTEESEDEDAGIKRGPDGKFQKGTAPPKKPEPEKDESEEEDIDPKNASVKQLLKNRERVAAKMRKAQEEATGLELERRKLAEETAKAQEAYRQIAEWQSEVERERQKFERLKKNPSFVARELGYDPEQFITELAREGTPEGQMARQQRELQEQLAEIRNWKEEQLRQQQEWQMQEQARQAEQYRVHIEKSFVDSAMNEDKYPHVTAFYRGREKQLIAAGDLTAYEFRELAGREGSLDEILDYLEDDLAERANSWYVKKSGTKKDSVSPEARPGKGSKGKSLTPEAASERRSLGRKELKDLDEDERREAAKAAVSAALEDTD